MKGELGKGQTAEGDAENMRGNWNKNGGGGRRRMDGGSIFKRIKKGKTRRGLQTWREGGEGTENRKSEHLFWCRSNVSPQLDLVLLFWKRSTEGQAVTPGLFCQIWGRLWVGTLDLSAEFPPDHQKNLKYLINSGFECDYNKTGSDTQTQAEDMRHRKVILYHKHRFSLLCDSAAVIAPVYLPDGRRAAENVLLSAIFPGDGR